MGQIYCEWWIWGPCAVNVCTVNQVYCWELLAVWVRLHCDTGVGWGMQPNWMHNASRKACLGVLGSLGRGGRCHGRTVQWDLGSLEHCLWNFVSVGCELSGVLMGSSLISWWFWCVVDGAQFSWRVRLSLASVVVCVVMEQGGGEFQTVTQTGKCCLQTGNLIRAPNYSHTWKCTAYLVPFLLPCKERWICWVLGTALEA